MEADKDFTRIINFYTISKNCKLRDDHSAGDYTHPDAREQ